MGKTLDQLNLTDEPLRRPKPVDPRDTEWYRFTQEIEDLLATGTYTWAESTLRGIQETVSRTEQVTVGQKQAVERIEASKRPRAAGYRTSRRYEGFGRGNR